MNSPQLIPGFITEEERGGEGTCLKTHMGTPVEQDLEPRAPATGPTCPSSMAPTPPECTAKGQVSLGTTARPWALAALAQEPQLIQGLKMPNTLERGL